MKEWKNNPENSSTVEASKHINYITFHNIGNIFI